MLTGALLYCFLGLMIGAALWDLATLQIPNWLNLAVLATFVAYAFAVPLELNDVLIRIGLGAAVLFIGGFLFAKNIAGGGDVKLLTVTALWIGWPNFAAYLLVMAIIGGGVALLILAFRRFAPPARLSGAAWLERLHAPRGGVPYGVAIGVAAVFEVLKQLRDLPL